MKYLCNDNKDSLDALKKEEETPEKKIDFLSPFIGSAYGNVIPAHLLNTRTAIFFHFSNSANSEKSKFKKSCVCVCVCETRKNKYSAFKRIYPIPITLLLLKLVDLQPFLSF